MKDGKNNRKRNPKDKMHLDEFFAEERFDEEDEDSVTDDTLEFLCLDDDAIESYQNESKSVRPVSKSAVSRYEDDEVLEDEDYEEEDYEDEDDEDEDEGYEDDEEYEDDDYEEDEDDEYEYDDDEDGVLVRLKRFLVDMSTLDMIVAMLGIVVIAGVIVTSTLFVNAKTIEKQVEAFASVGEEVQGISVIGESGLIAVSESAKLSAMIDLEEEPEELNVVDVGEEQSKSIEVTLNLTSIQSDLKIKFVNKATGKLIGGVPFEVEVSNGKKTFDLRDDDKDGIIYQTGIDAGTYQVTVKPFKDGGYEDYKLPLSAASVKVTDTIAYKKVDVADEVKSESEINAAKEDTALQDMTEESTLTDTVEWVESTKTQIDSNVNYKEINKDQIPDPATLSAAGGFMKMVNSDIVTLSEQSPTTPICTCTSTCENADAAQGTDCDVCKSNIENCRYKQEQEDQNCICQGSTKCTADSKNEKCPVCKADISKCEGEEQKSEPEPAECTCHSKCKNGVVDSSCDVCKNGDISSCTGRPEQEVQPTVVASINCPATLTVGSTGQASATTSPEGGTITWSSSDVNIVEIDAGSGKMTAKAVGSVTITAKCGDSSLTATVKVESVKYTTITLSGTNTVKVNGTVTVNGKTTPEGGTISWTSDNDKVAKIESSNATSATVKGVAAGTATITAKCGDATATCKVTVVKDTAGDTTSKLKDKNGKQVYVYKDGKYVEAVYADYYTAGKFYLPQASYRYTGWQTIDGSVYYFDKY